MLDSIAVALRLNGEGFVSKQISKLGDGLTTIESIGEINVKFYRNNWEVVCTSVFGFHRGYCVYEG